MFTMAYKTNSFLKAGNICQERLTQCRNLEIFFLLWLYVKSILESSKHGHGKCQFTASSFKFKKGGFETLKWQKSISHKIWVTENIQIFTLWLTYRRITVFGEKPGIIFNQVFLVPLSKWFGWHGKFFILKRVKQLILKCRTQIGQWIPTTQLRQWIPPTQIG